MYSSGIHRYMVLKSSPWPTTGAAQEVNEIGPRLRGIFNCYTIDNVLNDLNTWYLHYTDTKLYVVK